MPRHIIHKQTVRLEVPSGENVFAIQDRVRSLFAGPLGERLEALMDELAPPGKLIRLDSLHLNLGTIDREDFEDQFRQRLIGRLREALLLTVKEPGDENAREGPVAGMSAFLFFLSYGRLPWYSEIKDMAAWEEQLLRLPAAEWRLFPAWYGRQANQKALLRRLAAQFTDVFLVRLLALSAAKSGGGPGCEALVPEELLRMMETLSALGNTATREKLWTTVLDLILTAGPAGRPGEAAIWALVRNIPGLPLPEDKRAEPRQETSAASPERTESPREPWQGLRSLRVLQQEDEGSLWTSNSGIVILHPFLPALFGELGLVAERRFLNERATHRAVLLLHYLATGETNAPEFALVLQKILCGLPPETPVPARLEPTEKEKEECRGVLEAVAEHWSPLNRTSMEGLQTTFLQREGRLKPQDSGWALRIEKKTVDILLDKLPWGISLVRLPWMEEILSVEWTG
jgi:hypothetical protein